MALISACRLVEHTLLSVSAVYCQYVIIQHKIKCFTQPLDRIPSHGHVPSISLCLCLCLRCFVSFRHAGFQNTLFTRRRTSCFSSSAPHATHAFGHSRNRFTRNMRRLAPLTSPHLPSLPLTSPHLPSPPLTSPHLPSPPITSTPLTI